MNSNDLQVQLAALAKALVNKCGGFISAGLECDIGKSQLQRAADPAHPYCLKTSTIYHLERACGEPIMSRALVGLGELSANALSNQNQNNHPVLLGIDLANKSSELTVALVAVTRDENITINEHMSLNDKIINIQSILAEINYAILPSQRIENDLVEAIQSTPTNNKNHKTRLQK